MIHHLHQDQEVLLCQIEDQEVVVEAEEEEVEDPDYHHHKQDHQDLLPHLIQLLDQIEDLALIQDQHQDQVEDLQEDLQEVEVGEEEEGHLQHNNQ